MEFCYFVLLQVSMNVTVFLSVENMLSRLIVKLIYCIQG